MNDERKPRQDPTGHATIPPGLRPYLGGTAQAEEHPHHKDLVMDAAFAKIIDAIGEDVQEIDPDVGVGNVSKYVGPAIVPDGAKGKAFTAKVKIVESAANDVANNGDKAVGESPWASDAVAVVPAAVLPSSHAPRGSAPKVESASSGGGGSRGRAIAVAVGALGVVVIVGVWVVAQRPQEVVAPSGPAGSGMATGAPEVASVRGSESAVVAAPTAPPASPLGTSEVDAGASLAPTAPTGPAPHTLKGRGTREDPYDAAAPAPAITVAPIAPPPPSAVIPIAPAPSATTPKIKPVEDTSVF